MNIPTSKRKISPIPVALAVAAGAGAAAAALALRRWGLSEIEAEELAALPDAKELQIETGDGAQLKVFVSGPESPGSATFVLAHGWTNDSRVWAPVAHRLVREGQRVVVYDHRGHGSSTMGSAGHTLEALAEDMWRVLDELDLKDAVVVGHSMGGMTAQALATAHPERLRSRIRALVLVATACDQISRGRAVEKLAERLAPRIISSPQLELLMRTKGLSPFLVRRTIGSHASRAHLDSICEMFVATAPEVRAGFLTAMSTMDLTKGLPKLEVPVTVIAGQRDHLLPRARSRRIASLVPGSRYVEIPNAGHMLPIEVPDRITSLLLEAAGATSERRSDAS